MPERQPPRVSDDSPIGPDVDLERDDIRLADGTRLTPDIAAGIVEDVRRAAGRPSLTGPGRHSPQVSARVPAELRDAAEQQARREGKVCRSSSGSCWSDISRAVRTVSATETARAATARPRGRLFKDRRNLQD
jgi:hypothetical protein